MLLIIIHAVDWLVNGFSMITVWALAGFLVLANTRLPSRAKSLDKVSNPYGKPSAQDRSPEDKVTLWQFCTVSWLAPLLTLGNKRMLNEEDVWSLPYEFKHEPLHEAFREVQGTVVRRLIKANVVDLIIIPSLAILELACNLSTPIILQQLLKAIESSSSRNQMSMPAIQYATYIFAIRMIAAQIGVFSIWFCRRCYERSRGEMITMLHEKTLNRKIIGESAKQTNKDGKTTEEPASLGKILNIMKNDVYEVAQRFWEVGDLIKIPLGLILSVVLIWKLIGRSCLVGVSTVVISQLINIGIAKIVLHYEKIRRLKTDSKLKKINQFIEAIRHLRWYAWEEAWLKDIMQARQEELKYRVISTMWQVLVSLIFELGGGMFPVVAFYAYTTWAGKPLAIHIAFPALQLFLLLDQFVSQLPNLFTVLLNALVAVRRIEAFMAEPDKIETDMSLLDGRLAMVDASFAWPGTDYNVLHGVSLEFETGLNIIIGEVAGGKTALLQALLGELDLTSGNLYQPGVMIGYCAQQPWLQNMSIRENILFSSPFEEARYRSVIDACALTPDLANFKNGDLSDIGENGIGLSGGQKARVALARAVYSNAQYLLLDDPLAALDHQTADSIMQRCLKGPLMEGRTIVLVTHRVELCRGRGDRFIRIQDGSATILELEEISDTELEKIKSVESMTEEQPDKKKQEEQASAIPEKFITEEYRADGGVKARVYWIYIRAGKLKYWAVLVVALVVHRFSRVAGTWFLKEWGEAYDQSSAQPIPHRSLNPLKGLPSPEHNVRPWLTFFALIAISQAVLILLARAVMTLIVYKAARSLFSRVMHRVTNATFRFYDTTPVGRLMNRLTSDTAAIDGNLSYLLCVSAMFLIDWLSSLLVIASITPLFLLVSLLLTLAYIWIFAHFLPTSQSLRRLEFVSLTPLMSNFGALLHGLTTVRAFGAQAAFQARVIAVVDTFQKHDHFYWSLQAWLQLRFDVLSAGATLALTLLALWSDVSAGLTAFVLTAAGGLVKATHMLCKTYGQLMMDFVSVERVVELLGIEEEDSPDVLPPAGWPSTTGDIVFEGVSVRYADHLEAVLEDIDLTLPAGSNTAVSGRTGSGKSTLALSLLATVLPFKGRIVIDGIDISRISRQALRRAVTFLAQDPVLFPGKMRQNLDPLDEYDDTDCITVLQRIGGDKYGWALDTTIDGGGANLSQGQRQLVGLARAMLRRSSIVILDEATASIDVETASRIQEVLSEDMTGSTIITIAHRVEAVKNADRYVVLAKGRVVEQGKVEGTINTDKGEASGSVSTMTLRDE